MNKDVIWRTNSNSSEQTEHLAELIGYNLRGGEIIELVSDLGGGKTTFVRGLAKGIGSNDHVSSPSFKLNNSYKGKRLTLNHFDFYRLDNGGLMVHEVKEQLEDKKQVTAIEWAKAVKNVLPSECLTIEIAFTANGGRQLKLVCPKKLEYLLKGLK